MRFLPYKRMGNWVDTETLNEEYLLRELQRAWIQLTTETETWVIHSLAYVRCWMQFVKRGSETPQVENDTLICVNSLGVSPCWNGALCDKDISHEARSASINIKLTSWCTGTRINSLTQLWNFQPQPILNSIVLGKTRSHMSVKLNTNLVSMHRHWHWISVAASCW